jgi:nitrogen-specific signal transduction histidine kinase
VFTEESESLVLGVASQAAIAIDNARLFDEISKANEENKRLLEASRQSERKKDEFLSIASHELKTPLTSIKAYMQLLDKAVDHNERSQTFLKKADAHVKRMERLISDLLDVSKINANTLTFEVDYFNFSDAVNDAVDNAAHSLPSHRLIVQNNPEIEVLGDKVRIEQVINNFISNAVKYSPQADEVLLNTEVNNNSLVFSVQDFGIGIEPAHVDKIFDRFYRVEETSMRYQGLGLGLFISSEILKAHHGSFWLESSPGTGTTFYFSLPLPGVPDTQPALRDNHYEDDFIRLSYHTQGAFIEAVWKGVQTYESIAMGGKLMIDLVKNTNAAKVLNDNSLVVGNWADVSNEGRDIWFPALEQAGVRRFAWVQSAGAFSRLAAKHSVNTAVGMIELAFFDSRDEAHTWLLPD